MFYKVGGRIWAQEFTVPEIQEDFGDLIRESFRFLGGGMVYSFICERGCHERSVRYPSFFSIVVGGKNVSAQSSGLQITSPAFGHNQMIPRKYTCQGEDINPPLAISGIPEGQKVWSSSLTTPTRQGETGIIGLFTISRLLLKLKKTVSPVRRRETISAGSITAARARLQARTAIFFKLYALDTTLIFKGTPSKEALEKAMQGHILEKAELIGLYQKTR